MVYASLFFTKQTPSSWHSSKIMQLPTIYPCKGRTKFDATIVSAPATQPSAPQLVDTLALHDVASALTIILCVVANNQLLSAEAVLTRANQWRHSGLGSCWPPQLCR